ncbi:MAG: NUDIX hydrolase [Ruminiclostridium sp.]|nr:NUDIX hydrolase [Ruminiclostridium sp.]
MEELNLHLRDTQWALDYIDHDRTIARAIVFDEEEKFYFMRVERWDEFAEGALIETSGGGVEPGEDLHTAILRELKEELGVTAEILGKIGVVSDYYNLIHRHNINHYFLCRALSFGEKHLTREEREQFHLSTWKVTHEEALRAYEDCAATRLGKLLAAREVPVLKQAKKMLEEVSL